jgi:TolB-like protein/Flp pilus assembly protein TadD
MESSASANSLSPASQPSAKQIREQLARILRAPDFVEYPRSSALLTHVVEETLAGRGAQIKEATLGVEVFGCPPGYDSKADSVVRTQARSLRTKLARYYAGEGVRDSVLIEIPKGAYVPEFRSLQEDDIAPALPPSPNRRFSPRLAAGWLVVAVVVSAAALTIKIASASRHPNVPALAILSFVDLDPDRRFDTLAFGITEDLQRDLARVSALRLHATPPAAQLVGERSDYSALSRKLAVDALLEGEVTGSGNRAQIRVSLIRASDNSILWTDHFSSDLPAGPIEWQIEHNVARAMGVKLPPVLSARPENPQAHDLYFAARALWATRDAEKTRQAIGLFQQALTIDPGYALAYMGIADAYGLMMAHGQIDYSTAVGRGEQAARKALELDPSLAEAHAALGLIESARWQWNDAAAEYQRAIELNPSYDRAFVRAGVNRFVLGDFVSAERLMRESERLNPYSVSLPLIRAELYYYWRRYNDSEDLIRDVQKAEPHNGTAFQLLARDFFAQHQPTPALQAAQSAAALSPDSVMLDAELVPCLIAAGHSAHAAELLRVVLHPHGADPLDEYGLALLYARLGDKDNTLKHLEDAWDHHVPDLPSMRWDPALDVVRDDPRYRALAAKIYGS